MKNALIVGGLGYVGSAIFEKIQHTYNCRIYDSMEYTDECREDGFVFGNILNFEHLKPHLDWADVIFWLAAYVGDPACQINPEVAYDVNTGSLIPLVNFIGDKRFIFTSTCSVYGIAEGTAYEDSPVNPVSVYAKSKLYAEDIVKRLPNYAIARFGTLHGLGAKFGRIRFDLVVNTMAKSIWHSNRIWLNNPSLIRPLLHVREAASALITLAESRVINTFNVAEDNYTIDKIAKLVKSASWTNPRIELNPIEDDLRTYKANTDLWKMTFPEAKFSLTPVDSSFEILGLLKNRNLKNPNAKKYNNAESLGG